ncbi:hypothetical protein CRG98_002958 [Punica granatum]|uniref:Uncharacterized protein n=1 Tax=Punica granatum TaxID=22663 RepID=A0A2I0L7G2_PUNGR|nr:hypothetical protein CRG98_002958 [Punica granatum]
MEKKPKEIGWSRESHGWSWRSRGLHGLRRKFVQVSIDRVFEFFGQCMAFADVLSDQSSDKDIDPYGSMNRFARIANRFLDTRAYYFLGFLVRIDRFLRIYGIKTSKMSET